MNINRIQNAFYNFGYMQSWQEIGLVKYRVHKTISECVLTFHLYVHYLRPKGVEFIS